MSRHYSVLTNNLININNLSLHKKLKFYEYKISFKRKRKTKYLEKEVKNIMSQIDVFI